MEIAVLADIHGNMIALKAVLKYLGEENVNHFIIAGDHISDCPSPNEVLNTISKLNGWIIKGNREEYILETLEDSKINWYEHNQMSSVIWTRDQLDDHNIDFIRSLPEQQSVSIEDYSRIRVVHGSPDNIYEHLYASKEERLEDLLFEIEEEVLVCAHTHKPWSKRINGKLVLNPGALGVSFNEESAAEFAILKWYEGTWNVEHKRIKYDLNELEDKFKRSGLYNAGGIWSKLILESLSDGVNRNIEFIENANRNATRYGYSNYRYIPNGIWKMTEKEWENRSSE